MRVFVRVLLCFVRVEFFHSYYAKCLQQYIYRISSPSAATAASSSIPAMLYDFLEGTAGDSDAVTGAMMRSLGEGLGR